MTVADGQDSAESKIRHAAMTGELVDLHRDSLDHLSARYLTADGHAGQEIRAELLIELLAAPPPAGTPPRRAIRLCGATITGPLNLETVSLNCPLLLELCRFTEPVVLDDATAPKLSFSGCHVPGFSAKRLRTAGNLALDQGFTVTAGLNLMGARIGGQLLLNDARISRPQDLDSVAAAGTVWALTADGITVEQDLFARGQFTADGQVRLLSAHIKGQLDMTGAHLDASAARQFANPDRIALFANHLTVDADMQLEGISVEGRIYLRGADIGGHLMLDNARLTNPGSFTLMGHHMSVGQDMSCSGGFTSEGEISLSAARIGGHLSLLGASLSNPGRRALDAEWITIGQSLVCRDDFTADGEIALAAAQIGGQLLFLGASLNNPGGTALSAERIDIGQTMAFQNGSSAHGEIRMPGARIAGHASFDGAHLTSPDGTALDARSITTGLLRFRKGFTAEGQVNLEAVRIDGHLEFDTATLSNPGGTALNLKNSVITALSICPAAPPSGAVDLTGTRADGYVDDPETWPEMLYLRGFTYATLENSTVSVRNRLRWLSLHPGGYTPQVYDQLVACYQRAGHEEAARRVAIAKQWRRRNILSPLNWLWYITVGYGYRTWLAAIWLAALTIAGTLVFSRAHSLHLLRPAPHAPSFQPLVYTLDTLLPIVDFGQKSAWTAAGWALPWFWSLTAAGWVLTTAAVAALTGIFKRE